MFNVVFVFIFLQNVWLVQGVGYKFLTINCTVTDPEFGSIELCNHNESHISIVGIVKQPMEKIYVSFEQKNLNWFNISELFFQFSSLTFKKLGDEFVQIRKLPDIEWCSMMAYPRRFNFLVRGFIEALKESIPNLIHNCPYQGRHEFLNLKLGDRIIEKLPPSVYRKQFKIADGHSENFFFIAIDAEISTWKLIKCLCRTEFCVACL